MTLLLVELQKPRHLRRLSHFPSSTQEFLTSGQAPLTFLQQWLGSGVTVDSPSVTVTPVLNTVKVAAISYEDKCQGLGTR